jgi:hypothetical protein
MASMQTKPESSLKFVIVYRETPKPLEKTISAGLIQSSNENLGKK